MKETRTKRLLSAVELLFVILAILIIGGLTALYFWIGSGNFVSQEAKLAQSFFMGLLVNLIPVFLLFLGSYLIIRRIQQIRTEEENDTLTRAIVQAVHDDLSGIQLGAVSNHSAVIYEKFGDVPWRSLLSTCSSLDIVVHYFDTWINTYSDDLKTLLDRGGTIRIILPNFANGDLLNQIAKRFPEYDVEQVRKKIENTYDKLNLIQTDSTHKRATVEAYYVDLMIWYCGIRFDRRDLILSPYEHSRKVRVASPATHILLNQHLALQDWFERDFEYLREKSIRSAGT